MRVDSDEDRFPCPCCGHQVYSEGPGSYDICPLCFWEDDPVQLRWPNWTGGANHPSLIDAQASVAVHGAIEPRFVSNIRSPHDNEPLDPQWRPFDPDRDDIEAHIRGLDYGPLWPEDWTAFYYWRSDETRARMLRSLQAKVRATVAEGQLTEGHPYWLAQPGIAL